MSEQKENIGMWSLYAQPWVTGVKVAIDAKAFKNWIKNTKTIYKADPNTFEVDEHTTFLVGKNANIKYAAVAYSDFEGQREATAEHIHVGGAKNDLLGTATGIPALAGYIKNDAWDYEKEVRLRIDLNRNIDCDAVAIKLTQDLINAIFIVKGPRFNGDLQKAIENELKKSIPNGASLFFDRIASIPCDQCNQERRSRL